MNLEKQTKQELIKQIEAMSGANKILEGELKEALADLKEAKQKLTEAETGTTTNVTAAETIAELRDIIKTSCDDHCPHHGNPDACKNCGIAKRLNAIKETSANE